MGLFGGYSGRSPARGAGEPPKGATSRPAAEIQVRRAHCFGLWGAWWTPRRKKHCRVGNPCNFYRSRGPLLPAPRLHPETGSWRSVQVFMAPSRCHVFSAAQSSRIFLDHRWGDVASDPATRRFHARKHRAMCRGVIFCLWKAVQVWITPSRCHKFSAAQSSRIFLGDHRLTVWIMAPRHPQIANRIAKFRKAVPKLLIPFGRKISNVMKYPDPEGIIWQIISPISTLQSDPENLHFKYKSTKFGPHLSPEAVFRAQNDVLEPVSEPRRFLRGLGLFRAKNGLFCPF